MSELFDRLAERGFVQDATPGLKERLHAGPITAYVGFDPTADSLHVGSLVPVMGLAWLQRTGGTPIPLVGGGTGMVGDPSGKRSERPVLTVEEIDTHAAQIREQLARFMHFDGKNAARLRNNADWLRQIPLMEFLRDVGKHFTVGYMLQKESVKSRLESGISYTEFSYMLVQAYDFWHLYRTERCELQMGGSDQWGNITAGCELVARREQRQVHGLVFPLLTTTSGGKFGKSEAGNVWLDPRKTRTDRFHQFWVNVEDADIERLLKLFTFLPLEEIAALLVRHRADPGRRIAQLALADDVTERVHGPEGLKEARAAREFFFQPDRGAAGKRLAPGVPRHELPKHQLAGGVPLIDVLVSTGLASSKADARRGIEGRGYYVNGNPVDTVERRLTDQDLETDPDGTEYVILRKGKKTHVALVAK